MTTQTTIRNRGQMTIPSEVRKAAHIEDGDVIELELIDDGSVVLRPKKLIDARQAWFWTERWQLMEREVDEHVKRGDVIVSEGPDEFFADLEASLK